MTSVATDLQTSPSKVDTGISDNGLQEVVLGAQNLVKTVRSGEHQLTILDHISLSIYAGESVAIVGASGSGKSTLLGLLAGLDDASEGKIELLGHPLTDLNEDQRALVRAEGVGFVFQNFQLLNGLTALENVMLPLDIRAQRDAKASAMDLLAQVGLEDRAQHYPNQLSGGEQQRIALARAFAAQPNVLFADEPTGNLDSKTGERIISLLFELNRRFHTTLVLVTHDMQLAGRCQRRLQIKDGQCQELD